MDRRELHRARAALLELDRDAAVIIPPIRWHDAFVADFRPEILVEQIVDVGENSDATVAEVCFRRQVPNVVSGNEVVRSIIGVGEMISHDRADETGLDPVLPPIDTSNFELIIGESTTGASNANFF
jgi:hypothetical protein